MENNSNVVNEENLKKPTLLLENKKQEKETVKVYKQEVFDTYVAWKSIPAFLKNPPPYKDKVTKEIIKPVPRDYAIQMGIDEEEILELIEIPNQTTFAERYNVGKDTLSEWNRKIRERSILKDVSNWASRLIPNVIISIYRHAIAKGDPFLFKLYLQAVSEFEEKSKVEHKLTPVTHIEHLIITNENKHLIERETTGGSNDTQG